MTKKGMSAQQAYELKIQKNIQVTKLGQVRASANLSQSELAKLSGVPVARIQHYEQRVRNIDGARLNVLLDLCIALNCELKDILEDDENIKKIEKVMNKAFEKEISNSVTTVELSASQKNIYERNLINKYFYNESLSEFTDDQKAGIAFVKKDFPKRWREILELRYFDGLTFDEIATIKEISRSRAQQLVEKAIKRLEEYEKSEYVIRGLNFKEELDEEQDSNPLTCSKPIEDLKLSNRAYNALRRAGFETIGSVVSAKSQLINFNDLGKNSVDEICEKIDKYFSKN